MGHQTYLFYRLVIGHPTCSIGLWYRERELIIAALPHCLSNGAKRNTIHLYVLFTRIFTYENIVLFNDNIQSLFMRIINQSLFMRIIKESIWNE